MFHDNRNRQSIPATLKISENSFQIINISINNYVIPIVSSCRVYGVLHFFLPPSRSMIKTGGGNKY